MDAGISPPRSSGVSRSHHSQGKRHRRRNHESPLEGRLNKTGDCWLWTGAVSAGYGVSHLAGRTQGAHRVAWIEANGPIPDGLYVCHRCDVKLCCNPDHLFLGTATENMADASAKGRLAVGGRNGGAKLTAEDVVAIRSRYAAGGVLQRELAVEFGVHRLTVLRIVNSQLWCS